jgi:NAD(P)-dependent dehydrogenase (short-subunit alcohol dehydrogenase family)
MNILVTGGGRGIGAGIVVELARSGHNVAFCGRAPEGRVEAAEAFPVKLRYYQCDISDKASRSRMLEAFTRDFGNLDMLVNNAGVAPEVRADVLEMSEESYDRVMGINLKGPFFLTQEAARLMVSQEASGFRCIVNVGSVSAEYASISRGEYCLSKAGVAMATKLWAVRLADEGIGVYEIRPGVIRTDMTKVVTEKYDRLIAEGLTLQRRWGEPADIGKAVAAIAGGALGYSTGQVINVDGGLCVERF